MTEQPSLLDGVGSSLPGPHFVPRPGWGGQLRRWFTHNAYFIVFRLVIVVALILIGRSLWPGLTSLNALITPAPIPRELSGFSIKAFPGDGMTNLAARALDLYVAVQRDIIRLDATQHLHAVDALARSVCWCAVETGQTVSFPNANIAAAITSAQSLTPAQHVAWSRLLK